MHAVMQWAWAHGHCSPNPVDVVDHLLPKQRVRSEHHPAMPWKLIPGFIAQHVQGDERYNVTRALLLIVILTACRSGEARSMRWEEIDFKKRLWTIPADRMTAGVMHRVPLSDQVIGILEGLKGLHDELVFPSPRKQVALSDIVLTSFLQKVDAPSDSDGRVATAHDFRSGFRDWCSEMGYSRDLSEKTLAHAVKNKMEAAYHRKDLLEKRRPMMQAWADFVIAHDKNIT